MNTALLTFATAAFMALSGTHNRAGNDTKEQGAKFKFEKSIDTMDSNDQACDTSAYKIPAAIDLTVKEDHTY